MDLNELALFLKPENTVLLLGAGTSIPSGAPSGAALARYLATNLTPQPDGDDLAEISGIFENKLGRRALVDAVRNRLRNLQPTGGLLALPSYPWRAIYSTNFDQLVERAYKLSGRELQVVRSNYDFSDLDSRITLYKIHGCITQDECFGNKARMVLTELDYDAVEEFREALFRSLQNHMTTANTLIIGQSLRDAHLRDLAKEVAALRTRGIQGRVLLLTYEYNADRAALLEQRGIDVIGGSLEELFHQLDRAQPPKPHSEEGVASEHEAILPLRLASTTLDVSHAVTLSPDPVRLFNGAPATYADISHGLTISRGNEHRLEVAQDGDKGLFLVIAGAGGVGKTSLARRHLYRSHERGELAWEHLNDFRLDPSGWVEVEGKLRATGRRGVLLVDNCAHHLPEVNRLVELLGAVAEPALRVVITVNAAQWFTRTKSRYFFTRGSLERLSILSDSDIREMVNLVDRKPEIRAMVENDFLHLGHDDKVRRLRDRCSADMFVCLKNIFATEDLDNILLQEFSDLDESARDVYRHVAAIQAMGGKVHRQLIIRLLGIDADAIQTVLGQMEGVVDEYDIDPTLGVYGWTTRHDVIANIIATYKYADQNELISLLNRLIEGLNPTVEQELETARAIAAEDMGINRVSDWSEQVALLERLIAVVPGERTPRRRLIRSFLRHDDLLRAERAITASHREIGPDNIVSRYRVYLALARSEKIEGLLEEDRLAMLLEAEQLARQCIARQPFDRYNYRALSDVGLALARRFDDSRVLDDAIASMREAETEIPDPDFAKERRGLESRRRTLASEKWVEASTGLAKALATEDSLADTEG